MFLRKHPGSRSLSATGLLIAAALVATGFETAKARAAETAASAELKTYQGENGQTYFALSVTPPSEVALKGPRDIMILFDTSASQAGVYRETALKALEACIAKLDVDDRVQLIAVDLEARPLTKEFVKAGSDELRGALEALRREPPLGSTDMEQILRTTIARFDGSGDARRAVVYIGDGQSTANLLGTESFGDVVAQLRAARIPVNSYAIGPQRDARLLAALANQTGGNLYVDEPMAWADEASKVTAERAMEENLRRGEVVGGHLADWARATVVWPGEVAWPAELGEVYPKTMPALRTDRDTVVVGVAENQLDQPIALEMTVSNGDSETKLNWTATPETVGDSLSFLTQVVEMARADGGVTLPTLGTAGLAETGRLLNDGVDSMTALAERAIATGDVETAQLAAQAVLERDPGNVQAKTVQGAAAQRTTATPVAQQTPAADNELRLIHTAQNPSDMPPPAPGRVSPPEGAFPVEGALTDQFADEGAFLDTVEEQRRVFAQMLRREVENAVIDARRNMSDDPDAAAQSLKLALQNVERAPELSPSVRAQLIDRLQVALREVQRAAAIKDELDAERQEEIAAARERRLLNERLARDRERIDQLIGRFNALVDERRFDEAEEVAAIVDEIGTVGVTARVATVWSRLRRNHYLQQVARAARWNNYFDALYTVELSAIPFPDDPPIVYPEAPVWEELSNRRLEKYSSMDLKATGPAEERIEKALRSQLITAGLVATDQPLEEVVSQLQEDYQIPIQLDLPALDNAGLGPDEPVNINLSNVSLRSALRLMLKQLQLTYIIQDEVLIITTQEEAESQLIVKVYPVADLVLPIDATLLQTQGGGGGIGGGQQGGGGGGFGGGGQGGGGGGFGGGGGGGFGGGGGGQFSVPDQRGQGAGGREQVAGSSKSSAVSKDSVNSKAIVIDESSSPDAFWDGYFTRARADRAAVRETVRQLMAKKNYDQTIALIQSALRNGQPEAWMYEALGIAMQLDGRSQNEVERAIMSAVDFSTSTDELMYIAQYLARIGLDRRAMQVYQQVVKLEPLRSEAYALGLRAAERADELGGVQWATVGILSQAWPTEMASIELAASRVAKATLERLDRDGKIAERDAYLKQLQEAVVRDCVVRVSWTGNADIDVSVEEPAGTICSASEPRTPAGGVSLGDVYSLEGESGEGWNEAYVCPKGFAGTYRVRIHRVWGEVTAGKVTVDVYRHLRSGNVEHERQQIEIGDKKDAIVAFDLDHGRRTEKLETAQLAGAIKRQQAISQAVLAQQLSSGSDESVFPVRPGDDFGDILRRRQALLGGGAVGFQPIIQVLPEGTMMTITGVVSADRRYVRIAVAPIFSTIGDVQTFTFAGRAEQVEDGMGMDGTEDGTGPPPGPLFNLGGGGFGGR